MSWDYQFVQKKPNHNKILFVLTLDKKKMKERILIGEEVDIRFRLQGCKRKDGSEEVFLDITRPLGTLIKEFPHEEDGEWSSFGIMPLAENLEASVQTQENQKTESAAAEFLSNQFSSGNPVKQYLAFRIWNGYLQIKELQRGIQIDDLWSKVLQGGIRFDDLPIKLLQKAIWFGKSQNKKTKEVRLYHNTSREGYVHDMAALKQALATEPPLEYDEQTQKPLRFDFTKQFRKTPDDHLRLELWYPQQQLQNECVAAYNSFYPVLVYYMNRLIDWNLYFCKCKVCGNLFLATSRRYELCSEKCKKTQSLQNKRDFDERAQKNQYDRCYKNGCQHWRNKIKKAKKTPGFPAEKLNELDAAFDRFKAEALSRKNKVKHGKATIGNYRKWLFDQRSILENLLDSSD